MRGLRRQLMGERGRGEGEWLQHAATVLTLLMLTPLAMLCAGAGACADAAGACS